MGRGEPFVSPTAASTVRLKRKSPPTVVPFPISCLNCDECSDTFIRADFDSKTVRCAKCNHVEKAELYDQVEFIKACYYDSKPSGNSSTSGSSAFKKHQETAYLSMMADLERAKNENKHLDLKREELRLREKEMGRQETERMKQMEYQQMIEQARNDAMKIQNEATQAMTQLIDRVLPKKHQLKNIRRVRQPSTQWFWQATLLTKLLSSSLKNWIVT